MPAPGLGERQRRPRAASPPATSRVVRRCAAAAGPTISVNTSSTPTICAHSADGQRDDGQEQHRIRAAATRPSPRPAPAAGWRTAAAARSPPAPPRLTSAERRPGSRPSPTSTPSTLPNSSAVAWVAKAVKKCRNSRPKPERQRQHDADRHVALREPLAEQRPCRRRPARVTADQAPERRRRRSAPRRWRR